MTSETTETKIEVTPIETPIYLVYPNRFYVLFVFTFLAFNQSLIWLTFSPIARHTEIYYNVTVETVDLLLNWGAIIAIPALPLASMLLNMPNGLRYCVIVLAITDFSAALARIIPSIFLKSTGSNFNAVALPLIHIGQILNAACLPLAVAPVSQLSCIWFAPHERTRATTVAIIANNNLGQAIGFVISPYIVSLPEQVPRLLYLHFGLAFVACILTLIYFPARPPSAPSAAAELLINNPTRSATNHNWRTFLKDVWTCLSNPAFLFLSMAGGLLNAAFNAWPSLYDVLLEPENYTETQAG
jgi:FLVCR family MFS transporter